MLRKATEPIELMLDQLPRACKVEGADGIQVEQYASAAWMRSIDRAR